MFALIRAVINERRFRQRRDRSAARAISRDRTPRSIRDAGDFARPDAAIDPRRGRFRLVFCTAGNSLWPGVVTRERLVYAASMRILQLAMPLLRARHCIQMPQTRRLSFSRGCRTRTLGVINYVWSLRVSHSRPVDRFPINDGPYKGITRENRSSDAIAARLRAAAAVWSNDSPGIRAHDYHE